MRALEERSGLVVIDEIQRRPDLFELLRVLVDRRESRTRFLILGSTSPNLVKGVSESLAGRVGFIDLSGFDLAEVGAEACGQLWLRGGFPRSFLAVDNSASMAWRDDFVRTFLERDIPQLGISIPAETLRRFWTMIAHYHGQVWNAAQFARSLSTSENTARRYLDILAEHRYRSAIASKTRRIVGRLRAGTGNRGVGKPRYLLLGNPCRS
jgi:predicted AAA+ superfamily ATPase